jgi:addiction module RelE/StbE family toxin
MKNIQTTKEFEKILEKLPKKIIKKFEEKLEIFLNDEFDFILNNHKLKSPFEEYRSINITGDFRLLYKKIDDTYIFSKIGTHSQLYK